MSQAANIDPELLELLRGIAADPKANMFRAEIPRPERLALTGVPHIGLHAAGLTVAEREILRVYREDVASLLRDAAEWKIRQDPLGAATSNSYLEAGATPRVPQPAELLHLVRARSAFMRGQGIDVRFQDSVRTAEALLQSLTASAHQFAGLSLRLVPHDAAWIHVGRALWIQRQPRAAHAALAGVVRRGQSPRLQGSALTYLGGIHGEANLHANAVRAYAMASELLQSDMNPRLSWFVEAVAAGDVEQAMRASELIDQTPIADSPGLEDWLSGLEQRMLLNQRLSIPDGAWSRVRPGVEAAGPVARRLFDALR